MVRIKICGITRLEDAIGSVRLGADALGFVFHPKSPRYISPEKAWKIISKLPPFVVTVGVFVNPTPDLVHESLLKFGVNIIQLHGDEPPELCRSLNGRVVKAIRVRKSQNIDIMKEYGVPGFLLDTYSEGAYGGT
ncbi:MAG: N-(5'-phosphoribosyl)anthranilate isomerase, partial [Nitrospinota bacterium]